MFHTLYGRVLGLAASPRAPAWLVALAFAEACVFPVPPDLLLVPMCLARPERAWRLAGLCTAGSVAGGLAGYAIGAFLFVAVARPLLHAYGYDAAMSRFLSLYARWGFWVILVKGLTPIPFKIVTLASGMARLDVPTFVAACALTRGARFFVEAALLRRYGEAARDFIEGRLGLVLLALLALAVAGLVALRWL